ncbi:uncharacterized protein G2W53_008315 [Senna tora]|uniref:Uncharacterized protein n=1 Tax=Senna tora TaxID=362788 RepID=A0A834X9Y8_9FABA|nr:uncharacterized protein G2W53_008315 [Senna tora]
MVIVGGGWKCDGETEKERKRQLKGVIKISPTTGV